MDSVSEKILIEPPLVEYHHDDLSKIRRHTSAYLRPGLLSLPASASCNLGYMMPIANQRDMLWSLEEQIAGIQYFIERARGKLDTLEELGFRIRPSGEYVMEKELLGDSKYMRHETSLVRRSDGWRNFMGTNAASWKHFFTGELPPVTHELHYAFNAYAAQIMAIQAIASDRGTFQAAMKAIVG